MATGVATSALWTASASAGPASKGARCMQAQQRLMSGNALRIAAIPMGRAWSRRVGAVKVVAAEQQQRKASLRGDYGFDPLGLSESVQRSQIESRREGGVGGMGGGIAWRNLGMEREGWSLESVASSMQKCVFCAALAAAVALPQIMPSSDVFAAPPTGPVVSELAGLIAGPPVKDPDALLRYALPITNKPIKDVQKALEEITDILKVPGAKAIDPVERAVRQSSRLLNVNRDAILADVSDARKEEAQQLLSKLGEGLLDFQRILETKNRAEIAPKQKELLNIVGDVEEAMVAKFPYDVPSEYASKPLLKGRASVEMKVKVKDNPNIRDATFEITVDGYNAPVTAGNFIDLVVRRFYDGMEIQRADGFVVQTGDPDGPADGFVDPSTGKIRTIPLEIMVDGDEGPIYGATLEELGRFRERTKLPFNAFGTMAMAREEFEPDTASSQIFWLLKESELTPSNANILDGTFAVFGYVTQNEDLFADLKVGDVIESIKVTNGLNNLVNPSYTIGGA